MSESSIGLNFRNQLNSFYLCRFYLLFLFLSFQSYFSSLDAVISPLSVTISINISKAAIKPHYKKRLQKDTAHNNREDKDNSHIFICFFVLKMQIKCEALFSLLFSVYTFKAFGIGKPPQLNKFQYLDYSFLKMQQRHVPAVRNLPHLLLSKSHCQGIQKNYQSFIIYISYSQELTVGYNEANQWLLQRHCIKCSLLPTIVHHSIKILKTSILRQLSKHIHGKLCLRKTQSSPEEIKCLWVFNLN